MVIKDDFDRFNKQYPNCYAYTQTFSERLEKYKPLTQVRKIMPVLEVLHACGEFIYTIEFTMNNRIHLHGYLNIANPSYFHNVGYKLLDSYGMFRRKEIWDEDVWTNYCIKEQEDVAKVFKGKIPKILTHLNFREIYDIKKKVFTDTFEPVIEEVRIKELENSRKLLEQKQNEEFARWHEDNITQRDKLIEAAGDYAVNLF